MSSLVDETTLPLADRTRGAADLTLMLYQQEWSRMVEIGKAAAEKVIDVLIDLIFVGAVRGASSK